MDGVSKDAGHSCMASWVYMLRCADGSYYVGCTTNLERRIAQHAGGEMGGYTASRRPLTCVWTDEFQVLDDAISFERRIKRWSRAKKEALIVGDWRRIEVLSKRRSKVVPGLRP